MSKITLILTLLIIAGFGTACSSKKSKNSISIAPVSSGLVKNGEINSPIYLTNTLESRESIVEKTSANVFIIHTGHLLKRSATKEQNESILKSLASKGIDVVNLSIEDFIVADQQDIKFENYPQKFLNSSVVDLNKDNLVTKMNVLPFVIHDGVVLIGLSDKNLDKLLSMEKFLVIDYVLAILRARKSALKENSARAENPPLHSFVIVHTLGSDINDVMERLPPNFINSLAD